MKKVIPPVLFLICIVLMIGIRYLAVEEEIIPAPYKYLGIVLIFMGLLITIRVQKQFKRHTTEIHTFKAPKKLVTDGLFRLSRNPIYVGFVLSLIGVWVLLGTLLPISGAVVFFLAAHFWYIPYEEQAMRKEFGAAYEIYSSTVRRWI